MTSRAQQQDTEADRELYGCLNSTPPKSFLMVAGAGSGKTTSLIKGLTEILNTHGDRLRRYRQKVACITYTEIATEEIWSDVGNNPLVCVSTIHSFLWGLVRPFQTDIKSWVANRIGERLSDLREKGANFGPRVQARTREKNQREIRRYEEQLARIGGVRSFTYGTGSDYVNGILGHDDIIKMGPQFIVERPLIRRLVAQQFPFLFVDESQDTAETVVLALKAVDSELGDHFCLGFFGDSMQQIYTTGVGTIAAEECWAHITKPENFRCPASVLSVANAIRRDGDGLVQIRGRTTGPADAPVSVPGSAHIFILPSDGERDLGIAQVCAWVAEKNNDPQWLTNETKVLVIVHRMAANRLGFGELYSALNDRAPDKFKNGFLDGSAWPVRPFIKFVVPLVTAANEEREFDVMQILRTQSPLLKPEGLKGVNLAGRLANLRRLTESLQQKMSRQSHSTNAEVLRLLHESKVIELDPRIVSYLDPAELARIEGTEDNRTYDNEDDGEELTKEIAAMDAFLACPASQFWGYCEYLDGDSPFSTQQGVKGSEFERVLVVLDDDEGMHVQFSYDKYFGIKPLSDRDEENRLAGKETTVDRTRRLFYVCCTRAMKDLVVVFFTSDVAKAQRQIRELNLFPDDSIHLEAGFSDP